MAKKTAPAENNDPKREIRVKDHQTGKVAPMTFRAFQGVKEETMTKGGKRIYRYSQGATAVFVPKKASTSGNTGDDMGE